MRTGIALPHLFLLLPLLAEARSARADSCNAQRPPDARLCLTDRAPSPLALAPPSRHAALPEAKPLALANAWNEIDELPDEESPPILKLLRRRPSKEPFNGPVVPEPMVFDLVRPLHARAGEFEINVLALWNRDRVDWAPEVEIALDHGFAIEFELPMEDDRLEAYKFALQKTIGTAFEDQLIHGLHGIIEYFRGTDVWQPTLVHVTGIRYDDIWSTLTMVGGHTRIGGSVDRARTDFLLNASLFADLSDEIVFGIESNLAVPLGGNRTELLLMPQFHIDLGENLQLQCGFGTRFVGRTVYGEAGMRLIWEF